MAAALPNPQQCCQTCEETPTTAVPGPQGAAGAAGTNGTDGTNAYSTALGFTMPAESATVNIEVDDSSWFVVGQIVYVGPAAAGPASVGHFSVDNVPDATHVTLVNLGYTGNLAAGSVIGVGMHISPAGLSGQNGALTGAAGGSLAGSYPNPTMASTAKGDLIADDGATKTPLNVGTDGQMPVATSGAAVGIAWVQVVPNNQTDNTIPRFNDPAGTADPSPLQASLMLISDTGAIQSTPSGGNARGASAVDLQVVRSVATQVASGATSAVSGGENNTASATDSSVGGGSRNIASGTRARVGGGYTNLASATDSAVGGGNVNTASGSESVVAGGGSCVASGANSSVGGGDTNVASGDLSRVGGGLINTASAAYSTVGGGAVNTASGVLSTVPGGSTNTASATYSMAIGLEAVADKSGQFAQSSGKRSVAGDNQTSVLTVRGRTTDATPTELFIDGAGASLRLAMANNTSWAFRALIVGRISASGGTAAYQILGAIKRDAGAGTTALVAAVTATTITEPAAGWDGTCVADAVNGCLTVQVTGAAATTVDWMARVELVEVTL